LKLTLTQTRARARGRTVKNDKADQKMIDIFEETYRYLSQTQATLFCLMSGDQFKRLQDEDVSGCLWIIEEQLERIKVNHDILWSEVYKGEGND